MIPIKLHPQTTIRLQDHSQTIPQVQVKSKLDFDPFQTHLKQTKETNSFLVQLQEQVFLRNTID